MLIDAPRSMLIVCDLQTRLVPALDDGGERINVVSLRSYICSVVTNQVIGMNEVKERSSVESIQQMT